MSDAKNRLKPALASVFLRSAQLRRAAHPRTGSQPVRARARLESARIEETYRYFRDISANAAAEQRGEPTGRIELVLPYDGDTYFTRQACRDVLRARRAGAAGNGVLVGFLSLSEYERAFPGLHDRHGTLPVWARLPADQIGRAHV